MKCQIYCTNKNCKHYYNEWCRYREDNPDKKCYHYEYFVINKGIKSMRNL